MTPLDPPLSSPVGLHRVLEPSGVLPQAAWRLDPNPTITADEIRVRVRRLNLDAASYRQLHDKHHGNGERVREEVLGIIASRGKMHNPVTGSGGMLVGVVEEVGPDAHLAVSPGDLITTGTPPGVGLGFKPDPVFMKPGDVIELGVEGLGEQGQTAVACV